MSSQSFLEPVEEQPVRKTRRLPWYVSFPISYALIGSFALGAMVVGGLDRSGLASWMLDQPILGQKVGDVPTTSFSLCTGAVRVTCVVDGDTFWYDGVKIRVADFNTPEVGQPSCAAEAALGQRATQRFAELLSAGPIELVRVDRDEDQYGRKLRVVRRDGRSLGDVMVAEGLAHDWRGRRESWC